jgi:hypothetical protein
VTEGDPHIRYRHYRKEEPMPPVDQNTVAGNPSAVQDPNRRATDPAAPAGTTTAAAPTDPSAATLDNPATRVTPAQSAPGQPVTASAVATSGQYAAARQLIVNQPQKYDAVIRALERARGELDQQIQALRNDRDAHAALIAQGL